MKKKIFYSHLAEILEVEQKIISPQDSLTKYDWDSLKILELLSFADDKFKKLSISPDQINKCSNIKDLENLFKKYIN